MSTGYPAIFDGSGVGFNVVTTVGPGIPRVNPVVVFPRTGPSLANRDDQIRAMLTPTPMTYVPSNTATPNAKMRLVRSGVLMPEAEYEARFGDVPLETYRAKMSPEAFAVFVRFSGLVPGGPTLDMVRATEQDEVLR